MSEEFEHEYKGLTKKRRAFCFEFIVDQCGSAAAKRAGYSGNDNVLAVTASRLLKRPEVRGFIQHLLDERAARTEITADKVLVELAKLGFSDIRNLFTSDGKLMALENLDAATASAVQSIKITAKQSGEVDANGNKVYEDVIDIKLVDKISALEKLGKNLKLFTDKVEHSGDAENPIQIQPITFVAPKAK